VTDGERAVAFLCETYRRRVERVESFPWGELVVTPSLARVYDANFAIVTKWDGTAGELEREMDRVQAEAGFAHRKTVFPNEELADTLWPAIVRQGWDFASRYLLMAHRRSPDRAPDSTVEVVGVGDVDWARGRRAMIEPEGHGSDPELVRQLLELDQRLSGAMEVRHLAAVVGGEVASYVGLYQERAIAQIEDVATLPAYRNRGLARAVVLHAAAEARRGGAELVFLVADEGDWPKELYARLGFDAIGVEHVFGRSGRQHSSA
jgi:ribosomal protein S18 acetylase RimI-like enzyme